MERCLSLVLNVLSSALIHILQCILCQINTAFIVFVLHISLCCAASRVMVSNCFSKEEETNVPLGTAQIFVLVSPCHLSYRFVLGRVGQPELLQASHAARETHLPCQGCFLTCETIPGLRGNEPKCSWSVWALY